MKKARQITRKILASTLAALMILGAAPLAALSGIELPDIGRIAELKASAADEEYVDEASGVKFTIGNPVTITGYTDDLAVDENGRFTVPESVYIDGDPYYVSNIGNIAFMGCSKIKELTIPEKIMNIGCNAFEECLNLKKVYFNSNICTVGGSAFSSPSAFRGSGITEIVFGDKVTKIPANVCADAPDLKTVVFNAIVTEIGEGAFCNCPSLENIDFSNIAVIGEQAFSGCTRFGNPVFSNNIKTIGNKAFYSCNSISELVIPESTENIGCNAFEECLNLKKVYFNSNICTVSGSAFFSPSAFRGSGITEIVFGDKVTKIPANICVDAPDLKTVTFDGTVTEIGEGAFRNCSVLSDVYFNNMTEKQWNDVTIGNNNECLTSEEVVKHFNHSHKYGTQIIAPTCTEKGYTLYTCTCGDSYKADYVNALGHSFTHYVYNNDATAEKDGTQTAKCDRCSETDTKTAAGTRLVIEKMIVKIRNNSGTREVDYRSTVILTAVSENLPAGAKCVWFVNGSRVCEGETVTLSNLKEDQTVEVHAFGSDGKIIKNADGSQVGDKEEIDVNTSFFAKIIAFFRGLFRLLPVVAQSVKAY